MADEKKVVLQDTSNSNKHHEFEPKHAERLLAYPGTKWQALTAEKVEGKALPEAVEGAGEQEAPATRKPRTT